MGELGPDWQRRFKSFERTAARAASLGQVHRATTLDGAALACKLQYPDMGSAVEADLRQLRLAMGLYERYDRTVTTADIHAEIAARLREELDYQREAAHMRLYGAILKDEPGVAVPRPIPELSTKRLLTMTWLDGRPILDFAENASLAQRNEVRDRAQRATDQALDLLGAPALLPLGGLAVDALGRGAGEHRVLRGHPAATLAPQPRRHPLLDRRGAQDARPPELDEHRPGGELREVASERQRPQLVRLAPVPSDPHADSLPRCW